MGTRNITSVILDGKQVVCQYGQWDGYPTYTGATIMEFLRDRDLSQFRKALGNTRITVTDYMDAFSYTGSTKYVTHLEQKVYKTLDDLKARTPNQHVDWHMAIEHLRNTGGFSNQEYYDYLTSTRDTGCQILDIIYDHPMDSDALELFASKDEYDGNYSFDIQGIYVLNLDNNTLQMTFGGYSHTYDINELPKNIHLDMLVFESVSRELYYLEYEKFDFAGLTPEALANKATEIALKIGAEVQKDHANLLPDQEAPLDAAMLGKDLIADFLSKNAEKQKAALKLPFAQMMSNAEKQAAAAKTDAATPVKQEEPDL